MWCTKTFNLGRRYHLLTPSSVGGLFLIQQFITTYLLRIFRLCHAIEILSPISKASLHSALIHSIVTLLILYRNFLFRAPVSCRISMIFTTFTFQIKQTSYAHPSASATSHHTWSSPKCTSIPRRTR